MKLMQRMFMGLGGIATVAGLLSLMAPRAAHGLVAAMVQVVNTVANPAVTQDVSKLASQNIAFRSFVATGQLSDQLHVVGKDGVLGSTYSVPAGATLMITSVNFFTNGASSFTPAIILKDFANPNSQYGIWWGPPGTTPTVGTSVHFTYPTPIAIQAGIAPQIMVSQPAFNGNIIVQLNGYLSSN